jgi:multisubunit Na+/H+ antiporter MnhC subunit
MDNLKLLFSNLGDREYLRLLLEPIPIYGLMLGIIAFLAAFIFKERKMQTCALLLIMISAAAGLTTLKDGRQTGTRDKQVLVATPGQVAEQHKTREDAQWAYLSVAALAGVTILMGAHKSKPGLIIGIVTIGAATCLVILGMASHSRIHHPGPPQGTGNVRIPVATQRQAVKARASIQRKDQRQP